MSDNNFLEDLKKAVEDGNFNSDAAKRINDIDKAANDVNKNKSKDEIKKSIDEKVENSGAKTVDEDNVAELNSKYEEKMQQRAKEETIYATIATLDNLDNEIEKARNDLFLFIQQQRNKYDPDDSDCAELYEKINELTNKYKFSEKE
mgnify:CR=1 FL=1